MMMIAVMTNGTSEISQNLVTKSGSVSVIVDLNTQSPSHFPCIRKLDVLLHHYGNGPSNNQACRHYCTNVVYSQLGGLG
jgi:hypothetical protein